MGGGGGGNNSVTTRDVVVEADKAKEEAKYNSQSVTVITKEDIARKQGKSVEDVIFNEVGVTRTVDAMGKVGISIRGADPRHTLIMVDGQPVLGDVSKYSGNGDELMRIGAENIERIEIIRGAASAKYGSDAIGGVVDVITKGPKSTPSIQFNAEGRYHSSRYTSPYESSALPSNFFLRADSGKMGKFSISGWTSKRDIMPVYSKERDYGGGSENLWYEKFKPSLRYYGDVKNSGVSGAYEFNPDHKINFSFNSEREDVERRNKSALGIGGIFEPMQVFNRNMKRDTYSFSYKGRGGNTDWTVDFSHGKSKQNDVAVLDYGGTTSMKYGGQNALASVDWLEHERTDINVGMNTAINDKHLLSYGFGHTREWATGSRLKSAPKTHIETINPWDYDKSLAVRSNTASENDEPRSYVHNFAFKQNEKGFMWDKNTEFYGDKTPVFTYQDAKNMDPELKKYLTQYASYGNPITDEIRKQYGDIVNRYEAFNNELLKTNDLKKLAAEGKIQSGREMYAPAFAYYGLFSQGYEQNKNIKYNGMYYGEGYDNRANQIIVGEAEINKTYVYVQDTWQVNDRTTVTPSLRLDHSDLFGSQVTGNVGLLHNVNGNPKRRFKANVGTGYAEPGMGELYYNWEMFGAAGNHLGWYWIGNPNLKPEKSLNFDVSLEGESNKTFAKVSLFHNEIKDYLTSYFTGQLIDFGYNDIYNSYDAASYHPMPDRIYSFRNIGKAKITGLEAEVQQKFNDHWSGKLGYTLLHAVNASDSDMPHKLLDRPTHKVDIGLNYKNTKGDFRGALWGSYYIHMLDSNSVSTESLFDKDEDGNYIRKDGKYQEKTFGVWNVLFEKDFGKDLTAYVGVDNIFDHRDDDRAFQDRVYRFGVNIKLEDLGEALSQPFHIRKDKQGNPIITNVYGGDWFLSRPVDLSEQRKAGDVRFFGDYRVRSNMFKGEDKTVMRDTKTTQPSDAAAKNYADKASHGLEQRLRIGADYQIADGLNLQVVGSTAKRDTSYNVAEKRGLHDPYLEQAELTKSTKKWDWSVGRIAEPMGVTGYWFGKEYDGARVVYTDHKTQVSVGYGDFSQATGVTDSAYNHNELTMIQRAPTLSELLGLNFVGTTAGGPVTDLKYDPQGKYNYLVKFNNAKTPEEKLAVMKELMGVLKDINDSSKEQYKNLVISSEPYKGFWDSKNGLVEYINPSTGHMINFDALDIQIKVGEEMRDLSKAHAVNDVLSGFTFDDCFDADKVKSRFKQILTTMNGSAYFDRDGNKINNIDEAVDHVFKSYVGVNAYYQTVDYNKPLGQWYTKVGDGNSYNAVSKMLYWGVYQTGDLYQFSWWGLNKDTVPLPGAPVTFVQEGYLLKQDVIPAMDRAAYIKVRRQINDTVGIEAWKLNSFGEGAQDSHGLHGMQIADVLGIGTQIRLGKRSMLSFDYGQNRSDMGKFFHGGRDIYGDYTGGGHTPDFWVARLDIGIADTDMPGSWHAYLDYKAFDHGSFVGGTGADLPDRYLDGIRSFTIGIGYVPARNLLLEASYTFGAKSTQMRDTLYTPENFTLGDYTRVQVTYKF
ncbi:MAG: TonB-dependent receptor [Megasphaera cerevisiae]|nr:TonB-dependent receptor [Megasphaera cerevisiae]